ncbi:MAG: hypothetical protein ACJAQT_003256 [Akkermansiaceae bacterium]|jgi:hypothetical protein
MIALRIFLILFLFTVEVFSAEEENVMLKFASLNFFDGGEVTLLYMIPKIDPFTQGDEIFPESGPSLSHASEMLIAKVVQGASLRRFEKLSESKMRVSGFLPKRKVAFFELFVFRGEIAKVFDLSKIDNKFYFIGLSDEKVEKEKSAIYYECPADLNEFFLKNLVVLKN